MVWDWTKYIPWVCFEHHIMCSNTILQKPPRRFVASWKVPFFEIFFHFKSTFYNSSQHLLTKIFMSLKSTKSPLQNSNFGFFISPMVAEISSFFFQNTAIAGFQITTFTCHFLKNLKYSLQIKYRHGRI